MCHLQAHAHEGEDHAPGQVDALHGDVEEGEGEHDHHQAEVHVFERVLELARLFEHSPSHLPTHQYVIISLTVSFLSSSIRNSVLKQHLQWPLICRQILKWPTRAEGSSSQVSAPGTK